MAPYNGGGFVSLQTTTFNGNYFINNEDDGQDSAGSEVSGSFTFTDMGGAGNYTYLARIIGRGNAQFTHPGTINAVQVGQELGVASTEQ
jgi:hypothetical protein